MADARRCAWDRGAIARSGGGARRALTALGGLAALTLVAITACAHHARVPAVGDRPVSANAAAMPERFQRVSSGVYCGGQPAGAQEFAYLAQAGVRTLISVDGAAPDVEAARRAGLRYVHLPVGYDGIPAERQAELARAARDLPGPVYIHCHHGRHRAPAAAAAIEIALGRQTPIWGDEFLRSAGTAPDYGGLYRDVRAAGPLSEAVLAAADCTFPERATVSGIVAAMGAIDVALDQIALGRAAGWKAPRDHPDLVLTDQAALIAELLRELPRESELSARGARFDAFRAASESAAQALRAALRAGETAATERAHGLLRQSCLDCHRDFRN